MLPATLPQPSIGGGAMTRTSRRRFLSAAVGTTGGIVLSANAQQAGGPRGNPFARVQAIPDTLRRIPSDKYPLPFSDQEYTDRLKKTRNLMSKLGIDLLYVTLPE